MPSQTEPVRAIEPTEKMLDEYISQLERAVRESGTPGTPAFTTLDPATIRPKAPERLLSWKTPLHELGWNRAWGIWLDGKLVANAEIYGPRNAALMHRVTLSMAIELEYRGRGFGKRLLAHVL